MTWLKTLSAPEQKTLARHQARTDLYFLLRYILRRADMARPWLFERCREVQAAPDSHLDLWAREHYKSTIITFGKTIQDILASHGDDPIVPEEETIGIFSHARPISKGFLRQIKQEFETNDLLLELFPDVFFRNPQHSAPKWSEDEGITVKRRSNPKEATLEAWGLVDGQPIGKHFRTLIYDDVVTPASVTTPEMMKKTMEALELSYNLGAEGGRRRFIGTRYHANDAYRTIMERGTATPRIHTATDDGTATGEPVLMSREGLTQKRRDQGTYTFSCQMLLKPVADKSQSFQREWLKYYKTFHRDGANVYLLFDPANSKRKKSDYTAALAVALGSDQKVRIIDMVRDKLSLNERADLLFKWHRKYRPLKDGVRYEQYGKDADIDHFKDRMERENYDFDIIPVGGNVSKEDRIKRLMPKFENGEILLPEELHYTNSDQDTRNLVHDFIEQEYTAFPVPVHDDMLDALARLYEPDLQLTWPKPGKAEKFKYDY